MTRRKIVTELDLSEVSFEKIDGKFRVKNFVIEDYTDTKSYVKGELVSFNGRVYMAKFNVPVGTLFSDGTEAEPFIWVGEKLLSKSLVFQSADTADIYSMVPENNQFVISGISGSNLNRVRLEFDPTDRRLRMVTSGASPQTGPANNDLMTRSDCDDIYATNTNVQNTYVPLSRYSYNSSRNRYRMASAPNSIASSNNDILLKSDGDSLYADKAFESGGWNFITERDEDTDVSTVSIDSLSSGIPSSVGVIWYAVTTDGFVVGFRSARNDDTYVSFIGNYRSSASNPTVVMGSGSTRASYGFTDANGQNVTLIQNVGDFDTLWGIISIRRLNSTANDYYFLEVFLARAGVGNTALFIKKMPNV